jgi:outer membrane translocation and assembly module TamA
VRGWGLRRLSPRLEECDEENPDDCKSIPIGGQTSLVGNLELRVPIGGGFGLIGFVDAGDNQAGEVEYVPDEWNYSAGPGLRFDSPLGLIRLDLGFRLNDPGVYAGEPGWAIHFGFGEAF